MKKKKKKKEKEEEVDENIVENLEIVVVKDDGDGFGGDIPDDDEAFVGKELKICIGHSNASNSNEGDDDLFHPDLRSSNKEENKKEEEKEERRIEILVVTKDHNYKDIRSHVDEAFFEQDFDYTVKRSINANSNDGHYNALFHPNLSSSESHDDVGDAADIFELSSSGGSNKSFSKAGVIKEIEDDHSDRHSNNHCTSQIKHSTEKTVIHRRGVINRAAAADDDDVVKYDDEQYDDVDDTNNNNNNNNGDNDDDEQYDGDNENNHIV